MIVALVFGAALLALGIALGPERVIRPAQVAVYAPAHTHNESSPS